MNRKAVIAAWKAHQTAMEFMIISARGESGLRFIVHYDC
jgi:hypothetical protein